jgi:hypothetical protein
MMYLYIVTAAIYNDWRDYLKLILESWLIYFAERRPPTTPAVGKFLNDYQEYMLNSVRQVYIIDAMLL